MEPVAIYKLIILYMLDRAGGEIAMPRTSSFLIENGYAANFETLLQTYEEIEKNGFVNEKLMGGKTFLQITEEGEETLGFFANQLSDSIKQQIRTYLKDMGREITNEEAILGEYYRSTFDDYTVHLVVKEEGHPVVSIDLSVPDEESAKHVVASWKEKSGDMYQYIVGTLMEKRT
jgi:hypothetical protein